MGNSVGNGAGQGGDEKAHLRKAVIGGNLAFVMDDGELTNQHPALEIWWEILWEVLWQILWEILWEILREILQGVLWEIL